MLVMLAVTALLWAIAVIAIAKTTRSLMRRFGLDATTALLWLGLAEWPKEPSCARERAEERARTDHTARLRRGPARRSRGRRAARRPPAAPRPAR